MEMTSDNSSGLFYFGTDIEVELGDRVIVKRLFRKFFGIVAYIPGVSEIHDDLEEDGQGDWLIKLDRGDCLSMYYAPKHRLGQPKKNIQFIGRGQSGIILPSDNLGEE